MADPRWRVIVSTESMTTVMGMWIVVTTIVWRRVSSVFHHWQVPRRMSCSGPATGTTSIDGQCKSAGYLESYFIDKVEATPQCQADASIPSGEGVLCCMKGL